MPDSKQAIKETNAIGAVVRRDIAREMEESYLDYAMSVIVARALPDVRDGLKPVHRRILYAMHEMGLSSRARFRKSAAIVGEVLGKYHPHGDAPVYDALARMAQDFSLRYPLIDGQGNFGCFTKETEVRLADGRNLSFEKLVEEYQQGKRNFTFTIGGQGQVEIAEIKQPRLTRQNAEIVEVVLDSDAVINCTPDHRFMLRDDSYKPALELRAGEALMPLYTKLYEGYDKNLLGYEQIYQPKTDVWTFVHHIADEFNLAANIYARNRGRTRHHLDFNKLNNNPTNIQRMHWREHWQAHYQFTAQRHRQDATYREKLAQGRQTFWNQKQNRLHYSERMSKRNKQNWRDEAYRQRMRLFLSEINKAYIQAHPERRVEFSQRASATLKRLWRNPEHEQRMRANIIKGNKNHTTNKTGLVKFLNICRNTLQNKLPLTRENYERVRNLVYPYGRATTWEKGLEKYFQDNPKFIYEIIQKNHRVRSVRRLKHRADVYDLTIDKTHNFCLATGVFVHNSIDGDSPAAMRYTEARMSTVAEELLKDIEKETVNFQENYDGTRREPKVLPATLPQLLLNGTVGIAVGMSSYIPPHNLAEVLRALIALLENPELSDKELLSIVPGPDFPTGGIIYGKGSLKELYMKGKGSFTLRGVAEVEEERGRTRIILSAIPFQVQKSGLIESIAEMIQSKKLEGIRDIRDESDREGMRVVLELKGEAEAQKILNNLFRFTDLQKTVHASFLALEGGIQPRIMTLKEILLAFLAHRKEVVRRRSQFDLARAQERAHILEGLVKALDHIDEVISTIKRSDSREEASRALQKKFGLTEIQAQAILDMRLAALARLERTKIEDELKEKKRIIKELTLLLKEPRLLRLAIKKEFEELMQRHQDARRTKIIAQEAEVFEEEDLIPDEETIIVLSSSGYIKRIKPELIRLQRRGGKGVQGMETKEEDVAQHLLSTSTHARVFFASERGRVFSMKAWEIPEGSRTTKGKLLRGLLPLAEDERIATVLALLENNKVAKTKEVVSPAPLAPGFMVMISERGIIKRTPLEEFANVRKNGIRALGLKNEDRLRWAHFSSGEDDIMIATKSGKVLRFKEKDLRPLSRSAAGVNGIRLQPGDQVIGMGIVPRASKDALTFTLTNMGFAKKSPVKECRIQRRGGVGIKTARISQSSGELACFEVLDPTLQEIVVISEKGQLIRIPIASIPKLSRTARGVRAMKLEAEDKIAGVTFL